MCRSLSEGARRCPGRACALAGAILDRAESRLGNRVTAIAAVPDMPEDTPATRQRRRLRELLASAWASIDRARAARRRLRELERANDRDQAARARLDATEQRLAAAEEALPIETAALAIDRSSAFGRKAELDRALQEVEREHEQATRQLIAAQGRLRSPADDGPGPDGLPTARRQAANDARLKVRALELRRQRLTESWQQTPTVAEQEARVQAAERELTAARAAYQAEMFTSGQVEVTASVA